MQVIHAHSDLCLGYLQLVYNAVLPQDIYKSCKLLCIPRVSVSRAYCCCRQFLFSTLACFPHCVSRASASHSFTTLYPGYLLVHAAAIFLEYLQFTFVAAIVYVRYLQVVHFISCCCVYKDYMQIMFISMVFASRISTVSASRLCC